MVLPLLLDSHRAAGFGLASMIENIANYVDAGTGSMLLYAIAGALLSVVFTLKVYWYRLREKIANARTKNK